MKNVRWQIKKRLKLAGLLALPLVLLGLSMAWQAWQDLNQFKTLLQDPSPLNGELLALRLGDQWAQEWRRFRPASKAALQLPVVDLSLPNKQLPLLLQDGKHPFVPVDLAFQGLNFKGEARLRGYKPWHLTETKKSLRLKLKKGDFILAHRQFNLNNPDRPVLFEEPLVMELARQQGVMTTATDFLRLRLNGLDLGVFVYTTPLDEAILRRHHRIPADLYSLEKREKGFESTKPWQYVTWYDSEAKNFAPLAGFLNTLKQASAQDFEVFSQTHIALKAFATLEALHWLFAEQTSDTELNYGLYFDPYRGKWEPVLFEFTGLGQGSAPPLNDPLLTRLGKVPAYRKIRAEVLQNLLHASQPDRLKQRGQAWLSQLAPDLATDPYWRARGLDDANQTASPGAGATLRRELMRPMSLQRLETAFEVRLKSLDTRRKAVSALLSSVPIQAKTALKPRLKLGPGRIEIPTTRIFTADQPVEIAAGTTLALGAGASLIFHGPVQFAGSIKAPIRLIPSGPKRWGGLVLQGSGTAGSQLRGVIAQGGSLPVSPPYVYPGMINLHDTRQIALSDCRFSDNDRSDDLLHTAYIQDLSAKQLSIRQAFSDAWDMEFSQAQIVDLQINTSGDDGLDLMDTELKLERGVILASQGNGISAGEASKVQVENSLIAQAGTGVLAKNASQVQLSQSLLFQNTKGLEIYQESPYYVGWSQITGKQLFVAGPGQPLALDGISQKAIAPPVYASDFASEQAQSRQLAPLRQALSVSGLSDLRQLPAWLKQQTGARP